MENLATWVNNIVGIIGAVVGIIGIKNMRDAKNIMNSIQTIIKTDVKIVKNGLDSYTMIKLSEDTARKEATKVIGESIGPIEELDIVKLFEEASAPDETPSKINSK